MKIVVQKFSGNAVVSESTQMSVIEHIEAAVAQQFGVVVVVSAVNSVPTSRLTDHFLDSVEGTPGVSSRELDILGLSRDAISSVQMAIMLRNRGHDVIVLNGYQAGIITDDQYGSAHILEVKPTRILEALACGKIVIVMACQGVTKNGHLTRLGFGSSDTTAMIVATALCADYVDLFSDVDGIMTADPRIVFDARCLSRATYSQIYNLAYHGANIIHPLTVKIAMQRSIPIRVRRIQPSASGTLISNTANVMEGPLFDIQCITGITQVSDIAQIRLERDSSNKLDVFSVMQRYGINVDFISIQPDHMTFTVSKSTSEFATKVLSQHGFCPKSVSNCARVSTIGSGIANDPNTIARVFSTLSKQKIRILSSGNSHNVIWCLVYREDMEKAVRSLHQEFELHSSQLCS